MLNCARLGRIALVVAHCIFNANPKPTQQSQQSQHMNLIESLGSLRFGKSSFYGLGVGCCEAICKRQGEDGIGQFGLVVPGDPMRPKSIW